MPRNQSSPRKKQYRGIMNSSAKKIKVKNSYSNASPKPDNNSQPFFKKGTAVQGRISRDWINGEIKSVRKQEPKFLFIGKIPTTGKIQSKYVFSKDLRIQKKNQKNKHVNRSSAEKRSSIEIARYEQSIKPGTPYLGKINNTWVYGRVVKKRQNYSRPQFLFQEASESRNSPQQWLPADKIKIIPSIKRGTIKKANFYGNWVPSKIVKTTGENEYKVQSIDGKFEGLRHYKDLRDFSARNEKKTQKYPFDKPVMGKVNGEWCYGYLVHERKQEPKYLFSQNNEINRNSSQIQTWIRSNEIKQVPILKTGSRRWVQFNGHWEKAIVLKQVAGRTHYYTVRTEDKSKQKHVHFNNMVNYMPEEVKQRQSRESMIDKIIAYKAKQKEKNPTENIVKAPEKQKLRGTDEVIRSGMNCLIKKDGCAHFGQITDIRSDTPCFRFSNSMYKHHSPLIPFIDEYVYVKSLKPNKPIESGVTVFVNLPDKRYHQFEVISKQTKDKYKLKDASTGKICIKHRSAIRLVHEVQKKDRVPIQKNRTHKVNTEEVSISSHDLRTASPFKNLNNSQNRELRNSLLERINIMKKTKPDAYKEIKQGHRLYFEVNGSHVLGTVLQVRNQKPKYLFQGSNNKVAVEQWLHKSQMKWPFQMVKEAQTNKKQKKVTSPKRQSKSVSMSMSIDYSRRNSMIANPYKDQFILGKVNGKWTYGEILHARAVEPMYFFSNKRFEGLEATRVDWIQSVDIAPVPKYEYGEKVFVRAENSDDYITYIVDSHIGKNRYILESKGHTVIKHFISMSKVNPYTKRKVKAKRESRNSIPENKAGRKNILKIRAGEKCVGLVNDQWVVGEIVRQAKIDKEQKVLFTNQNYVPDTEIITEWLPKNFLRAIPFFKVGYQVMIRHEGKYIKSTVIKADYSNHQYLVQPEQSNKMLWKFFTEIRSMGIYQKKLESHEDIFGPHFSERASKNLSQKPQNRKLKRTAVPRDTTEPFNLGDKVFGLIDNKIVNGEITQIRNRNQEPRFLFRYARPNSTGSYPQRWVFEYQISKTKATLFSKKLKQSVSSPRPPLSPKKKKVPRSSSPPAILSKNKTKRYVPSPPSVSKAKPRSILRNSKNVVIQEGEKVLARINGEWKFGEIGHVRSKKPSYLFMNQRWATTKSDTCQMWVNDTDIKSVSLFQRNQDVYAEVGAGWVKCKVIDVNPKEFKYQLRSNNGKTFWKHHVGIKYPIQVRQSKRTETSKNSSPNASSSTNLKKQNAPSHHVLKNSNGKGIRVGMNVLGKFDAAWHFGEIKATANKPPHYLFHCKGNPHWLNCRDLKAVNHFQPGENVYTKQSNEFVQCEVLWIKPKKFKYQLQDVASGETFWRSYSDIKRSNELPKKYRNVATKTSANKSPKERSSAVSESPTYIEKSLDKYNSNSASRSLERKENKKGKKSSKITNKLDVNRSRKLPKVTNKLNVNRSRKSPSPSKSNGKKGTTKSPRSPGFKKIQSKPIKLIKLNRPIKKYRNSDIRKHT